MTIMEVSKITGVSESFIEFYIRLFDHEVIRRENGRFLRFDIADKDVPFVKWWHNIGRPNHRRVGRSVQWKLQIRDEFLEYYGLDKTYWKELAE